MKYDVLTPGLKEIQITAEAYYLRSDYITVEKKKKSGCETLKMFLEKISSHLFKE